MKLIIFGGRDFNDHALLISTLNELQIPDDTELVSGMARGADILAYNVWKSLNLTVHEFPADWDKYGKSAGYRRNTDMGHFADAGLGFWDGNSRGTKHMIDTLKNLNKQLHVVRY